MKKAIFILLGLLLVPSVAHAGILEFVITVAATVIGGPAGWSLAARFALGVALAAYGEYKSQELKRQTDEQERQARDTYNNSLKDRTITSVATETPFVTIYGRARVGSAVVAILPSGPRDEYQHIVAIHAAHECDAIEEIYIAKKALGTLDADGFAMDSPDFGKIITTTQSNYSTSFTINEKYVAGTVVVKQIIDEQDVGPREVEVTFTQAGNLITPNAIGIVNLHFRTTYNYRYSSVRVKKHLGVPGEAADATLIAECPGKWGATSKLSGFCYTYVRLDLNQQEFQGGLVGIEALIRGKKLLDPRDDTTAWSQNPALALYDYLLGDNCGVPAEDIPVDYVCTAADVCDEAINIGARYNLNGTVTSGQDQPGVITQMAQAMAGGINSTTWEMWAGKYVAPTLTLEQADIVGDVGITPGLSDADIFNGVTARFISAENDYTPTDMVPYQNATYRAADGRDLFASMELPFTNETQRAHNLARIYVEDQRNSFTFRAAFSLKAWDTKIGQRVTLNASFFGFTGKVFRVVGKTYGTTSPVDLLLKEDAPEIWDLADAVVVDATPNSGLPNPFLLDAPASLSLTSGTAALLRQADGTVVSRIKAEWPAGATIYAAQAEIQIKLFDTEQWQTVAMVDATLGVAYLAPVNDGETYDTRIRFINPYLAVQSPWTDGPLHTVVGKTEPPPDVASFAVELDGTANWPTMTGVPDLAGYRIRWHPGNNTSWGDATPLHTDLLQASPYAILIRPTNTATFMIKAVDQSGNESVNVAASVINLGDPIVANVVSSFDYKAAGWPGVYTGAVVSGGDLAATPDASPLAWDVNAATNGWTLDTDPGWTVDTYGAMAYQPDVFIVDAADAGAQLTLTNEIAGAAYLIEYRRDGDAPGWTSDAEPGWTDDADLAWITEAFRPWPGTVLAQTGRYEWQITIQSRDVRGLISQLAATLDVVDQFESVGRVAILAGGTVIPTSKVWRQITAIGLTLVADGGTARSLRIESPESARTVTARDASNVSVDGTALVTLQGF